MVAVAKTLQAEVLALEVRLFACQARLQARTDDEALHDMRIALRKLRSLLRPLRRQPLCAHLEQAATALAQASGPLRDLEVLLLELQAHGLGGPQHQRRAQLEQGYTRLLDGLALQRLLILLDAWPADCREAVQAGEWHASNKQVRKYLRHQVEQLGDALRDPAHDRHRLRLLIKRLRYCAEAYPRQSPLTAASLAGLRTAQGALGDWHDCLQWLARCTREPDLAPCLEIWGEELAVSERAADQALDELLGFFPKGPSQS